MTEEQGTQLLAQMLDLHLELVRLQVAQRYCLLALLCLTFAGLFIAARKALS